MSDAPVLQADDLSLLLSGRRVVDRVSVAMQAGQWIAIVGPNGAGKSSLLSVLAGLRAPSSGQVQLRGRRLSAWRPVERA